MQAETRHLVLLAEYNTWMNAKVYRTCAGMPELRDATVSMRVAMQPWFPKYGKSTEKRGGF